MSNYLRTFTDAQLEEELELRKRAREGNNEWITFKRDLGIDFCAVHIAELLYDDIEFDDNIDDSLLDVIIDNIVDNVPSLHDYELSFEFNLATQKVRKFRVGKKK